MSSNSQTEPSPGSATFPDVLRRWVAVQPRAIAFHQIGSGAVTSVDFATLGSRVEALAASMEALIPRGQRVVVALPGGIDFIVGFLACLASGSVAVTTDIPRRRGKGERLRRILDDSEASAILTTEALATRLRKSGDLHALAGSRRILALSEAPTTASKASVSLSPAARDLAMLQYTSGSTSAPRGVMLTHEHLVTNCRMISDAFALSEVDVSLSWLPPHHDMGLVGGILTTLLWGRAGWLMPSGTFLTHPLAWLRAISEHGITVSGAPDFAYRWCVERIPPDQVHSLDLSRWRIAFTGAERVRPETLSRFSRHFAPAGFRPEAFFPCYGLAEATLMVSGGPSGEVVTRTFDAESLRHGFARPVIPNPSAQGERRVLTASGRPVKNVDVAIVADGGGRSNHPGGVGEIWIRSPSSGLGYWNKEVATREVFAAKHPDLKSSWLRTGDLGFLFEERLFVLGRLNDQIIIRGTNFFPEDLEGTIEASVPGLVPGGIAVISANNGGEDAISVLAERTRDSADPEAAIASAIRNSLATEHGVAASEVLILKPGDLPRTSSGKIRRHACRDLFENRAPSCTENHRASAAISAQSAGVEDLLLGEIAALIHTCPSTLSVSTRLDSDLGLDSLGRVSLLHRLAESRKLHQVEASGEIPETVGDLFRLLDSVDASSSTESPPPGSFAEFEEIVRFQRTRENLLGEGFIAPYFRLHEELGGGFTCVEGREFVQFGNYNYLGLSLHSTVTEAAARAARETGTSSGASRLVTGNRPVHVALEEAVASFLGTESALAFVGGHATNETVLGHLFQAGDLILHDQLAHNSLIEGARLSGARRWAFPHNDAEALDAILTMQRRSFRRAIIVIEGIYSMDGDFPDLPRFIELKRKHRCLLMVDEAHSLGTLGETGRGIGEHFRLPAGEIDLLMGTLSKALASCGGFIAGSRVLVDYLSHTTPGFVYSVGMPPTSAAAALAALEVLIREPERVRRLQHLSRYFHETAGSRGIALRGVPGSPVIPLLTGGALATLALSRVLEEAGFVVPPVLPPAVPEGGARLRFFLTTEHRESQIDAVLETLAKNAPSSSDQPKPLIAGF